MPVAVIVTVGAGALMMLTGRANEMLAVRADTGAPPAAGTGTGVGAHPTAGDVGPAFVSATLSGYPGQRGSVTVASMAASAGVALAVGRADGHPAIWRRAANGSWTLESATTLGALTGAAGLVSVAHGPAGWIAVGAASDGSATAPVILVSADGVRWQPLTALAGRAGAGTEFLGAAAGRSGYVVVGRQMVAGRTFAVLWYSADLRTGPPTTTAGWTAGWRHPPRTPWSRPPTASSRSAPTARTSRCGSRPTDGTGAWTTRAAAGAASATLRSVAATGSRVVAGGYAATRAATSRWSSSPPTAAAAGARSCSRRRSGLGLVTALTATPDGFTAAGVVGRRGSQHAVTWTSPDGLTWSAPAQARRRDHRALRHRHQRHRNRRAGRPPWSPLPPRAARPRRPATNEHCSSPPRHAAQPRRSP